MKNLCILFSIILFLSACSSNVDKDQLENKGSLLKDILIKNELRVCTTFDIPGLAILNTVTGKMEGFEPTLAKEIAKQILGNENGIRFLFCPESQRFSYLESEKADFIIATLTITPEREKLVDFSIPYFVTGQSILVNKESSIKNLEDLNRKKVGVYEGTTSETFLLKYAPEAIPVGIIDFPGTLLALENHSIDALVADRIILECFLFENEQAQGLQILEGIFSTEYYGVAVKKGQDSLLQAINNAIKKNFESGEWERNYNEHLKPITGFSATPPMNSRL
jgi:putative glutamine transport system substrate-binding protein